MILATFFTHIYYKTGAKVRKNERKGKFLHSFSFFICVQASKLGVFALFRVQVTSPKEKGTEKREQNKINLFIFYAEME